MSSKTEIANLATSHLGIDKEIANIDTENSAEARACRRFFDTARDMVLSDFPWPFATKFADLALVEEDPTIEWGFSYRYPSDCLTFRRILNGVTRIDTLESRVKYKIGRDTDGQLIYTDMEDAQGEYTIQITSVELYPPDFTMALSLLLAGLIGPRISGGDPFKKGDRALALYRKTIANAQALAIGEEQPDRPAESEFISGRD